MRIIDGWFDSRFFGRFNFGFYIEDLSLNEEIEEHTDNNTDVSTINN